MGGCPAHGDLDRRPGAAALGSVSQDDNVQMIRHHGVGQDVEGEGAGRLADQLGDPGAAVLCLIAAEVGAADAAGDDTEGAGTLVIDQEATGEGHGTIVIYILSTLTRSSRGACPQLSIRFIFHGRFQYSIAKKRGTASGADPPVMVIRIRTGSFNHAYPVG